MRSGGSGGADPFCDWRRDRPVMRAVGTCAVAGVARHHATRGCGARQAAIVLDASRARSRITDEAWALLDGLDMPRIACALVAAATLLIACDAAPSTTSPTDTPPAPASAAPDAAPADGAPTEPPPPSDAGVVDTAQDASAASVDASVREDAAVAAADASSPPAVDCTGLGTRAGTTVCAAMPDRCEVVFEDGAGCAAVCASAGLRCGSSFEDVTDACMPDHARPPLACADTGHESDYCVCVAASSACAPDCAGRSCGGDGCGGSCGACAGGATCEAGTCRGAVACSTAYCPAFPGAEGAGMFARGGRGGDVYHVTTTADSGGGSLRDGIAGAAGPRTIVFDVGGRIDLRSPIRGRTSRLTIAGQTAPGDGITISGYQVEIFGDDNIIRHLRFRPGDERKRTATRDGFTEDALTVGGNDVIVDHVSASWGIDECLSASAEPWNRITVQWSIVAEGLRRTRLYHGEYDADHPGHSMGGLFKPRTGDSHITIHHTLFAHNNNRNPAIGTYLATQRQWADIRNNVVYDCPSTGYNSGESDALFVNYVGNYLIAGPESSRSTLFTASREGDVRLYLAGNFRDLDRDGRFDGSDGGSAVATGEYTASSSAHPMAMVTTHDAPMALELVLAEAGARPWSRDSVDARIVSEVRAGRGAIIDSQSEVGGWGTLATGPVVVDTDRDGMPDAWERDHGTNPTRADDAGDADGDGYTNLEGYLHWAARMR